MAEVGHEEGSIEEHEKRDDPLDLRLRRHASCARSWCRGPTSSPSRSTQPAARRVEDDRRRTASRACRSYRGELDHIEGVVYAKDVLAALHTGERDVPIARGDAAGALRAASRSRRAEPAARDAAREVPHGDRRRRVRLDVRPGHARGSARGAGRRDRGRARRDEERDVEPLGDGALPRRRGAADRRARTSCSAPTCRTSAGTRSAASCSASLGTIPTEGEQVELEACASRPRRCRAAA